MKDPKSKPGEAGAPSRQLKKIRVGTSSESSEISSRRKYRVRIDGQWYEGSFRKEWFGWMFDGYESSGIQLNLIDEVYEITSSKKKGWGRR
jgi:hypothetical protein